MRSKSLSCHSFFPLILLLAGLAVYAKTFFYGFLFDDIQFIVLNPAIRSLHSVPDFFQGGFPLTRITTLMTFAFNYKFYGLSPAAYHIWNFIIHMAATFSVWWLARIIFARIPAGNDVDRTAARSDMAAFFVALIFCVHPLQTQAVTYLTQRFASLSALFYILSVTGYVLFRLARARAGKVAAGALCLGAMLLAVTSKEEAVTVPLMMAAAEFFFFDGFKRSALPGWLVAVVFGTVFFTAFSFLFGNTIFSLLSMRIISESHDGDVLTAGAYLLTQGKVFMTFWRLFIWPFPQTLDHDLPMARSVFDAGVLLGLALSAAAAAAAWHWRKTATLCAFGLAWGLIAFSANLVPRANLMWEHKFYLMSFGFVLFFVALIERSVRSVKLFAVALGMTALFFAGTAFLRNDVWKSDIALWQDVVLRAPDKARANVNMGDVYFRRQMYDKALPYYERALKLAPKDPKVLMCAATLYFYKEDYLSALSLIDRIILLEPGNMEAFHLKARIHEQQDQYIMALQVYDKAVDQARLSNLDVYAWRAGALIRMGQDQKAYNDLSFVLKMDPSNIAALTGMAQIFMGRDQPDKAFFFLDQAVRKNPHDPHVHLARALWYIRMGDREKSWQDIRKAFNINPFDPDVQGFVQKYGK